MIIHNPRIQGGCFDDSGSSPKKPLKFKNPLSILLEVAGFVNRKFTEPA
jgi:hypothetical protein